MFHLCLHHFYGTKCAVKLSNYYLVQQFNHWRSKNKELLELDLEKGSVEDKKHIF